MTTMRQDEPRGFGNKRKLGRLRCASLLGLALLVAACADRGPAGASCLLWLTRDAKTQDIALSGDGTRAAVFEDPKSLFSRPAELVIYDAQNGRRLTSGHYGYSLKWIGDEIFMTAPAGAVRAWNPNLGSTRTVLICDRNDQDPTGSCRFDIGPGGSVVWRTMGEPPRLAFSPSPGAQAAWTSPVSVIGTPGLSPDGRLVAAQIVGGYFVVLETERGTVISTASGPFGWGNHKAAWISPVEFLVRRYSEVDIYRYNVTSGTMSPYVTIPVPFEPDGRRGVFEIDSNHDGSRLLVLTDAGDVYVVDAPCLKSQGN